MLMKVFAGVLLKGIMSRQKEIIADAAKEQALLELRERARRYFLAHVSKTVADEYLYNTINYVKSLELMELEMDISPQQIQDLVLRFSDTLEKFERDFSQKLPDQISTSEIIRTLGPTNGRILGAMMQPPQSSPSLVFINKFASKPASYQPLVLREHHEHLAEQKAIELWDEIIGHNFQD